MPAGRLKRLSPAPCSLPHGQESETGGDRRKSCLETARERAFCELESTNGIEGLCRGSPHQSVRKNCYLLPGETLCSFATPRGDPAIKKLEPSPAVQHCKGWVH